jgi:hypothetical protein
MTRACTNVLVIAWGVRWVNIALVATCGLLLTNVGWAEQQMTFGEYEVHYIVLPTTDLNAKVADKYDLPRGRDRALVNVSVLDGNGTPVSAKVSGSSENLLGQRQQLSFTEVTEGTAIYYLSLLRHADEEYHRVALNVELPNGEVGELRFRQQMFWDR